MKWEKVVFRGKRTVGKDALNNEVEEMYDVGKYYGRFAEWTADEVNVLGREFTATNTKVLIKSATNVVKDMQISAAMIGEVEYMITQSMSFGARYVLIYIKGYAV